MKNVDLKQETTLSVHQDLIREIKELTDKTSLHSNDVILYCITRFSQSNRLDINYASLSVYQERCYQYKSYHVSFPHVLYEKCFDLRKATKLSLSLIFAIAFKLFAHELLEKENSDVEKIKDSYHPKSYEASYFYCSGEHFFSYIWKKPPK